LLEPPDIGGAAVGIETSTVEGGRALIKGRIDPSHELVVRIDRGDKPIEWRSSRTGGGEFEVVVEASDKIRLEGGKTGHGFVVTTTILTSSDVTYVPCGGDLAGTFAIRRQADFVTKNGVLTFADVTLKDGKKLPVSLRLAHLLRTRSSDNTNAPRTAEDPSAAKAQPQQGPENASNNKRPGPAASSASGKDGENQDVKQGRTKSSGTRAQNDAVPERFETGVLNDDVRWDARGLKGPFDILSAAFDPASQQITWTLRATPRHGPAFDFHAVLYDTHGQVIIQDAPLAWSTGRREDGTVHLASLDVRWLARRVADSAPQVASAVIERHPDGALGRTRQIDQGEVRKRTPEKLATGILPDDAIWRHDGFRSNSEALEVTFDPAAGKVTWVLEALPRTYQGRSFRVSFYDRAGNAVGPGAPLIWSSGKRDNHPVELAMLDLAYFVELLGDRTRDVATVAVERIGEP
jgi:hypothetical protein